jgi:dipeptidyl aminopeptidase/acylaminoacyl peptidase
MRNPSAARYPSTVAAVPSLLALLALLVPLSPGAAAPAAAPASARTESDDTTDAVYRTPAQVLVDMVDAPPTPGFVLSPKHDLAVILGQPNLDPVEELSRRELRLGGLRIDPATHGPSRFRYLTSLTLIAIDDGRETPIEGLPAEPRVGSVELSPDGEWISFTHTADDRIELWAAEVATARARRLGDARLNLAARHRPAWLPGSRALVVPVVPAERGPEPEEVTVPGGPVIQESSGRKAPARTYQDLLEDAHDEALFDHYLTARLARVGVDGTVTPLGEPGVLWSFDPSPDGRFLLAEWLHRPYSYLVPAYRFPKRVEVLGADGERVREVVDLPLHDAVPIAFGSVPPGPREHAWRDDAPATLTWAEALDGGDAGAEADERDRLFLLPAPFDGEPVSLATLELRFDGVEWGEDDLALVSEWWWPTRRQRTWRVRPGAPEAAPEKVFDFSWEDRYNDPGAPLTTRDENGREVLRIGGGEGGETLYLVGDGASPEGDRPFLDALDLSAGGAGETERLFRSEAPYYERPVDLLDAGGAAEATTLLTHRESVEEPLDLFVRDLAGGDRALRRLTDFPHPTPDLLGVHKELIRYPREDGVELTATLYLPPGHDPEEDGPLPLLVWAYPTEYKSADAASQVTDSPHRFVRVGWYSPLVFLARGYAVLDDPGMPIIGEGEVEPNDSYVEQLVSSARAAVDEMVRRGVTEPGKIAIGGHSYGAFMTANLLAHSDLFAAGIARSGAYNRTLTPFGFQAEERTVWDAPEVYVRMSPFMHAEKVDEPILLIHGDSDNNSGTFPMQSERFYSALKGLGGTARLVMLPLESHGYRGRESVLHMLWEMDRWLESHVKNGGGEASPDDSPAPAAAAEAASSP